MLKSPHGHRVVKVPLWAPCPYSPTMGILSLTLLFKSPLMGNSPNPLDRRRVLSCRSGHGNCLPLQWFNHTMYYCRLASHISIYPKFQPGVRNPFCSYMYAIICKLSFKSYRIKTFCRWGSVVQPSHPVLFHFTCSWNNLCVPVLICPEQQYCSSFCYLV